MCIASPYAHILSFSLPLTHAVVLMSISYASISSLKWTVGICCSQQISPVHALFVPSPIHILHILFLKKTFFKNSLVHWQRRWIQPPHSLFIAFVYGALAFIDSLSLPHLGFHKLVSLVVQVLDTILAKNKATVLPSFSFCVCERECVFVCVCVCVREREMGERVFVCVCVCVIWSWLCCYFCFS